MVASTTITTPSTLLDAINELLRIARIGRLQTMDAVERSLDGSGALDMINKVMRRVLGRGWEFNTEKEYVLMPNSSGIINLPTNALKVTWAKYQHSQRKLLVRSRKLYDNEKHSFVIAEEAIVDMVVNLPFEDLPDAIKDLVTAQAAMEWCPTKLPSGTVISLSQQYLRECEMRAMQDEVDETGGDTLKDTSPHFSRWGRKR